MSLDLLKFLGIPSLLFLPGVLMLITWRFLALRGKSDEEAKQYKPQWNTSDFWVIAVALSLITALTYPWLTVLVLTNSRNFLVGTVSRLRTHSGVFTRHQHVGVRRRARR